MACCSPPEDPEFRIVFYLLLSLVLLLLLISPRLGLIGTVILAALYFFGTFILSKLDPVMTRFELALRRTRQARNPGLFYCPECGLHLKALKDGNPVPHYCCPSCSGAWCGLEELSGAGPCSEAKWKPEAPGSEASPLRCPKCKCAMERGGWAGAPLTVHRCAKCATVWVPRLSWAWLEMELPRP